MFEGPELGWIHRDKLHLIFLFFLRFLCFFGQGKFDILQTGHPKCRIQALEYLYLLELKLMNPGRIVDLDPEDIPDNLQRTGMLCRCLVDDIFPFHKQGIKIKLFFPALIADYSGQGSSKGFLFFFFAVFSHDRDSVKPFA